MLLRLTWLLVAGAALAACGPGSEDDPGTTGCDPVLHELGRPLGDRAAFFRTSGGEVRLSVSDLPDDTALGPVRSTAIAVGPGDTAPAIDPASPGVVPGSLLRETVRPDEPLTTRLEAGDFWLVSSNGGLVTLSACPDVEITDVRPADASGGDAFTPGAG